MTNPTMTMPELTRVEVRVPVDATEAPNVFDDDWPDGSALAVEIAGPGVLATLVVPTERAREWAGELFTAVSVAYRELTGDPHALSDDELAALPAADGYQPGPGLLLAGDEASPARARFVVVLDIEAEFLSTGGLRAAIVEALCERFTSPGWRSQLASRSLAVPPSTDTPTAPVRPHPTITPRPTTSNPSSLIIPTPIPIAQITGL